MAMLMAIVTPLCLFGQHENHQAVTEEEAKAAMTDQEWLSVEKKGNPVKRVRKLLEIADGQLAQTRTLTAQEKFVEATTTIQNYTTIISYALHFIEGLPENQHKQQRSAYKEFDVRVRKQIPTLKELKHEFPVGNQVVDDALFTAERLRIIALNRFSGAEIIKVPEP